MGRVVTVLVGVRVGAVGVGVRVGKPGVGVPAAVVSVGATVGSPAGRVPVAVGEDVGAVGEGGRPETPKTTSLLSSLISSTRLPGSTRMSSRCGPPAGSFPGLGGGVEVFAAVIEIEAPPGILQEGLIPAH